MATHPAIATVAPKSLAVIQVPTVSPKGDEVRVRVQWTASTPLDLHQNDGWLLVTQAQVLGDGVAGTVVETGPDSKLLKVGDRVFGFCWREQKEKAYQEFCTAPEWLFGKLPEGSTMQEAVTLPNNFVTAFHSMTTDLGIELPWPRSEDYVPKDADKPVLIWGGSSSVGQYTIQILRYYGYKNILATASAKQHDLLRTYGATHLFDYRSPGVVEQILTTASELREGDHPAVPLILDCIGSMKGSIAPISKIAEHGSKVAVLLPVIVRDSSETEDPIYEMDVRKAADWALGVDVRGVRTHHYLQNEFFKHHLQPEIMPTMLKEGMVRPNKQNIVQGASLLERAEKAMEALRRKEVSGERLVWKISED